MRIAPCSALPLAAVLALSVALPLRAALPKGRIVFRSERGDG